MTLLKMLRSPIGNRRTAPALGKPHPDIRLYRNPAVFPQEPAFSERTTCLDVPAGGWPTLPTNLIGDCAFLFKLRADPAGAGIPK